MGHRVEKPGKVVVIDGKPVAVPQVFWLFATPVALDRTCRILWHDADRGGDVRYDYVQRPSWTPGGINPFGDGPVYWRCDVDERPAVVVPTVPV